MTTQNLTQQRIKKIAIILALIFMTMAILHFGGSWAVATFKEMHGL
jgi:hypothetical protein